MKAQIVFGGTNINYIVKEVKVNNQKDFNTSAYIGQSGSTTNFVSENGKVLSFKSLCKWDEESSHNRGHRINDYKYIADVGSKSAKVLTSPSQSGLNGNYLCTGFDFVEDTQGNFEIDWEFTEVIKFNVVAKTFRVWGKATSSKNTKKKTTTKKSTNPNNLNSNVKYLLKTCPLMSKGHTGKKCVLALQKFLQSKGYYKNYKLDGIYAIYTEKAVKGLQKQYKLKATGKWDKATRSYWQKKYKYPTTTVKATAIESSNVRKMM